jgi:hypothetical protein
VKKWKAKLLKKGSVLQNAGYILAENQNQAEA